MRLHVLNAYKMYIYMKVNAIKTVYKIIIHKMDNAKSVNFNVQLIK